MSYQNCWGIDENLESITFFNNKFSFFLTLRIHIFFTCHIEKRDFYFLVLSWAMWFFIYWVINCSCFPDCFLSQSILRKGKALPSERSFTEARIFQFEVRFSVLDCNLSCHLMPDRWIFCVLKTNDISLFPWRLTRNNLHSFHLKFYCSLIEIVSRFQIS